MSAFCILSRLVLLIFSHLKMLERLKQEFNHMLKCNSLLEFRSSDMALPGLVVSVLPLIDS